MRKTAAQNSLRSFAHVPYRSLCQSGGGGGSGGGSVEEPARRGFPQAQQQAQQAAYGVRPVQWITMRLNSAGLRQ